LPRKEWRRAGPERLLARQKVVATFAAPAATIVDAIPSSRRMSATRGHYEPNYEAWQWIIELELVARDVESIQGMTQCAHHRRGPRSGRRYRVTDIEWLIRSADGLCGALPELYGSVCVEGIVGDPTRSAPPR
jgi:hypothetical protein